MFVCLFNKKSAKPFYLLSISGGRAKKEERAKGERVERKEKAGGAGEETGRAGEETESGEKQGGESQEGGARESQHNRTSKLSMKSTQLNFS